jgi:hypothetical protein
MSRIEQTSQHFYDIQRTRHREEKGLKELLLLQTLQSIEQSVLASEKTKKVEWEKEGWTPFMVLNVGDLSIVVLPDSVRAKHAATRLTISKYLHPESVPDEKIAPSLLMTNHQGLIASLSINRLNAMSTIFDIDEIPECTTFEKPDVLSSQYTILHFPVSLPNRRFLMITAKHPSDYGDNHIDYCLQLSINTLETIKNDFISNKAS